MDFTIGALLFLSLIVLALLGPEVIVSVTGKPTVSGQRLRSALARAKRRARAEWDRPER